jgi:hypothetical protein
MDGWMRGGKWAGDLHGELNHRWVMDPLLFVGRHLLGLKGFEVRWCD